MNLTTAASETITPDNHNHISPDTDGTRVVWIENDDIFVNDTSIPESETQITFTYGATVKDNLRISGNRIVWWETDGATNTVYLFTIGAARNLPGCRFHDPTVTERAGSLYRELHRHITQIRLAIRIPTGTGILAMAINPGSGTRSGPSTGPGISMLS